MSVRAGHVEPQVGRVPGFGADLRDLWERPALGAAAAAGVARIIVPAAYGQ